jgi:hypothetical protein
VFVVGSMVNTHRKVICIDIWEEGRLHFIHVGSTLTAETMPSCFQLKMNWAGPHL